MKAIIVNVMRQILTTRISMSDSAEIFQFRIEIHLNEIDATMADLWLYNVGHAPSVFQKKIFQLLLIYMSIQIAIYLFVYCIQKYYFLYWMTASSE